jgi:hypothetical protein
LFDQVCDLLGLLECHARVKEKGGDAGSQLFIYMVSNSQ